MDEPNFKPIRSTTQIWVVTRHQCGLSAVVPQTSFRGETIGGFAKCRLFSQARQCMETSVENLYLSSFRRETGGGEMSAVFSGYT